MLTFEDPPEVHTGRGPDPLYAQMAAQLRANPGAWAVVKRAATQRSAASIAYWMKRGKYASFRPEGSWDTRSRTVDGEHRVYARWIGTHLCDDGAAGVREHPGPSGACLLPECAGRDGKDTREGEFTCARSADRGGEAA